MDRVASLQGEKRRSMRPISGPDTPNHSSEEPESFCARHSLFWRPSSASKIASMSNCGAIELRQSFTSRTILSLSCRHP